MLIIGTFLARQRAPMYMRNHHIGTDLQLGPKGGIVSNYKTEPTERTLKT